MSAHRTDAAGSVVRGGELTAYLTRAKSPDGGGMLLLPMITGIGERVREFAADLAEAGMTTVCWDPFEGASSDTHGFEQLSEHRHRLDDRKAIGERRRLLDCLCADLGVERAGVIGYCLGGRFALLLAAEDSRGVGVVAYHPTVPPEPAENHSIDPFTAAADIRAPVLVHYAGRDHLVQPESLAALEGALRSRDGVMSVVSYYPDAEHGFSDTAHHGTRRTRPPASRPSH